VRDKSGKTTHFIGIQSDITARKEAEASVREANKKLAIVNAKLRNDLEAAARIQQSTLPTRLPDVEGVTFAWDFRPCDELAGDNLNLFRFETGEIGLYVLDVSGHGVPAALLSVTLSHWLSPRRETGNLVSQDGEEKGLTVLAPADVGTALNRQFQMDMETTQYFTIIYGILNPETLEFKYLSAGHPPVILQSPGQAAKPIEVQGFPVGITEQAEYRDTTLALSPGDRLFLYSDGVADALSCDETSGAERLAARLDQVRKIPISEAVKQILDEVEVCSCEYPDDNSILALEIGDSLAG
jgi:sigma-B regulation protein RsbU (phosphoserine phosphatase)